MKIKFFSVLIACITLLPACKNSIEEIDDAGLNKSLEEPNELPGLSIYNLEGEWLTQNAAKVKLENFRGNVVVVGMIYLSCRSACPIIISDMMNIEKRLPAEDLKKIAFLLITIDPENDTPEVLKKAAEDYKLDVSRWTILNGSDENIRELAATLSFKYKKTDPIDFAHSNLISVLDQNGVFIYQQTGLETDNSGTINQIHELISGRK